MASNVCKSSCACAHEFNRSICTVVARLGFVYIYTCCIIAKVEWLVIACILSECTWHRTIILCFSKCLATVGSATVFCKSIVSTIRQSIAVASTLCSLYSATSLDQKTTVGNAGAGKIVCICMHAHTNCKGFGKLHFRVFWAAYK